MSICEPMWCSGRSAEILSRVRGGTPPRARAEQTEPAIGGRHARANPRGQVMAKLARRKPGCSTTIHQTQRPNDSQATTTEDKLSCWSEHWTELFKDKGCDPESAETWLSQAYPNGRFLEDFPSPDPDSWNIRKADIENAISLAGASAPGPDGVAHAMWKQLGDQRSRSCGTRFKSYRAPTQRRSWPMPGRAQVAVASTRGSCASCPGNHRARTKPASHGTWHQSHARSASLTRQIA